MKNLIWIILSILGLCVSAQAAQVTLAWDPNNPTPEGYRIYQRDAGGLYDYSAPAWTGPEITATIYDLDPGQYFYVVRAFVGDQESGDSNEVEFMAPELPCLTLLDLTGVSVADIAPGTYLVEGYDFVLDISTPPEDNDTPPYSVNRSMTIYHRAGCRWYNPDQGITDPADCPTCRPCRICGVE